MLGEAIMGVEAYGERAPSAMGSSTNENVDEDALGELGRAGLCAYEYGPFVFSGGLVVLE